MAVPLDGVIPPRRDESGCEVSKRGQDEEALGRIGMGNHEEAVGLARIEGHARRRPVEGQTCPPEDEEIEVELPGPPAPPVPAAEGSFELLQRDQERGRAGCWVGTCGHIQGDRGVAELGLVLDADRSRRIEARNAAEPRTWQGRQGPDAGGKRRRSIAEVRAEAHVCPDMSHWTADLRR